MSYKAECDERDEGFHVEDVPMPGPGATDDDFDPLSSSAGAGKGGRSADPGERAAPADSFRDHPADQDLLHFAESEEAHKPSSSETGYAKSVPEQEVSPVVPPASRYAAADATCSSKTEIGEPAACHGKDEQLEGESCGCCTAWLSCVSLPPSVSTLLLWRNIYVTGGVLFGSFTILLSLAYFSVISVFSYASLAVLVASATFKVYRLALAALCKDSAGSCYDFNPFSILEGKDVTLSADYAHRAVDVALPHFNCTVLKLKRLFLVEDVVSSLKFGLVLWAFTYVGCCFNGLTLVMLELVMAFTLPKVYDTYKVQIDRQVAVGCEKFNDIYGKYVSPVFAWMRQG